MSYTERHTIDELFARYELEPTLRDVYVEGKFDCEVLERHFPIESAGFVFYEIDTVDIPPAELKAHGLTDGCKHRVICLSRKLATIKGNPAYRCLVDRDLDHWIGTLEATPRLVWTAYCSLELYFFDQITLSTIITTTAKAKIPSFSEFIGSFTVVLGDLYSMRLADRELGWSMKWLAPDKSLSISGSIVSFDTDDFVNRLLLKNGRAAKKKLFVENFSGWRTKVVGDPRLAIRGHDFIELVGWSVGKFGGHKSFAHAESIERLLVLLADRQTSLSGLLP